MMLRRIALLALVALTLAAFAPVLGVLAAGGIATALGCDLDEGSVHPCLLWRHDVGDALYTGFVAGWLAFVTWPAMLVSLGLWARVVLRWSRRRRSKVPPG